MPIGSTDIFELEFPEFILGKWHVGGICDAELVSHSDTVMQSLWPVVNAFEL